MKYLTYFLLFLSFQVHLHGVAMDLVHWPGIIPDSIPPSPPGNFVALTGPDEACVGETSVYFAEVPVACTCQWAIDGIIQPDTGNEFSVTWDQAGLMIVTLTFVCSGGQTSSPQAIPVGVYSTPLVDLGPDTSINQGQSLVLDAGNPGSEYLWSTGETTQTIEVTQAGIYTVTVTNICGEDWDDIEVSVIIAVPEDPARFDGKVYYDGEWVRIYPGKENIQHIKIMNIGGQVLYEGSYIDHYRFAYHGIIIVSLFTEKKFHAAKIFIQ